MMKKRGILLIALTMVIGMACRFSNDFQERIMHVTPTKSNYVIGRYFGTSTPTMTGTATNTMTSTVPPTITPTATLTTLPTQTYTETPSPTATLLPTPSFQSTDIVAVDLSEGCSGADEGVEAEVLTLINSQRSKAGVGSVSRSDAMSTVARNYSRTMAENDFFDHGDIGSRINASGLYFAISEILYAGMGPDNSPSAAVAAWLNSPNHRGKMLSPIYSITGIGYWCDPHSTYGGYYTVDFASP